MLTAVDDAPKSWRPPVEAAGLLCLLLACGPSVSLPGSSAGHSGGSGSGGEPGSTEGTGPGPVDGTTLDPSADDTSSGGPDPATGDTTGEPSSCSATAELDWSITINGVGGTDDWTDEVTRVDGGVVALGHTETAEGGAAAVLLRLDDEGGTEWIVDGPQVVNFGRGLATTPDDGVAVCASTIDPTPNVQGLWIARFGPDGALQWEQSYMGFQCTDLAVAPSGDIVIAARTLTSSGLFRFSAEGELVSAYDPEPRGGPGHLAIADIAIDAMGNVLATGRDWIDGGTWIGKVDPAGVQLWASYTGDQVLTSERPFAVAVDDDGGPVVVSAGLTPETNDLDLLVQRLHPDGELDWRVIHSSAGRSQTPLDVAIAADGTIAIAGYEQDPDGTRRVLLVGLSSQGAMDWLTTHEVGGIDEGRGIASDGCASLFVVGGVAGDGWIARFSPG